MGGEELKVGVEVIDLAELRAELRAELLAAPPTSDCYKRIDAGRRTEANLT